MKHQIDIEQYEVEAIDSLHSVIESMCIAPSIVTRMTVDGRFSMSDSGPLRISNMEVMKRAHGNVLLFGLGLGLIVGPILAKEDVTKVTVIEYLQENIDAVVPSYDDPRLHIIQGDARDWLPPDGEKYDIIYFDIFTERSRLNLPKMQDLIDRYSSYLKPDNKNAWIECFYRRELTDLLRATNSLAMEIQSIQNWCIRNPDKVYLPYDPDVDIALPSEADIVTDLQNQIIELQEKLKVAEDNWDRLANEIDWVSSSMPTDWDDLLEGMEEAS